MGADERILLSTIVQPLFVGDTAEALWVLKPCILLWQLRSCSHSSQQPPWKQQQCTSGTVQTGPRHIAQGVMCTKMLTT